MVLVEGSSVMKKRNLNENKLSKFNPLCPTLRCIPHLYRYFLRFFLYQYYTSQYQYQRDKFTHQLKLFSSCNLDGVSAPELHLKLNRIKTASLVSESNYDYDYVPFLFSLLKSFFFSTL